jgi:hypothetical protein
MSRYTAVVVTSHSRDRFTYPGDGMLMDRVPFERADAPGKGNCDKGATTTGHLALIITGRPIRSVHGSDLFGWRLVG